METQELNSEDSRIAEKLYSCPHSLFVCPRWIRALSYAFKLRFSWLAALDDGAIAAAMPFAWLGDELGGPGSVSSLPFSDHTQLVGDENRLPQILELARRLAPSVAIKLLFDSPNSLVQADSPGNTNLAAATTQTSHWCAIRLTDRMRDDAYALNRARHATQAGVTAHIEGATGRHLNDFHSMHVHLRRTKYHLLAQPLALFQTIVAEFGDSVHLVRAELSGQTIATLFCIRHDRTIYYKYAASNPGTMISGTNDLLITKLLTLAEDTNSKEIDLGLSNIEQPGLIRFKRKYATHEGVIAHMQFGVPDANRTLLRQSLAKLIDDVTRSEMPDRFVADCGATWFRHLA